VAALAAAIGVQRTLPELFLRFTAGSRVFGSLRILLRHASPSEASLAALQQAFEALPDEDRLDRDLMLRRARLIEDRTDGFFPGTPSAAAFVFHPFLTRAVRLQIEQFPEAIAAARQPWPDKVASLATLAADGGSRMSRGMLRNAVLGRLPNVAALSASPYPAGVNLAIRRIAAVTLAVERYRRAHQGRLPPALDAVVPQFLAAVPRDPFSRGPIVYKTSGDGYLVYSLDANKVDDGGAFYGTGSMNPMPLPKTRDFGIKVPLTPRAVAK
jgi:hypothetical protein